MAPNNPWLLAGVIVLVGVVAKGWLGDLRAARRGTPYPHAFPGATPANRKSLIMAAGGALVLLAMETTGEHALGLSVQQSRMTGLFAVYTLAAAFAEELIFRGYLVIENRGRMTLLAGIVGASLLFALIHPFLWEWQEGSLRLQNHPKAWFSTGAIFAGSLWFYAVRFMPLNPTRSLLPCIAAHLAKNAGVIAVKASEGFLDGWW